VSSMKHKGMTDRESWRTKETIVRGGTEGGLGRGAGGVTGTAVDTANTRWQREDLESMLASKNGGAERDGDGVRAELLAQKAIYELESHGWRHPLARLATIWGGWRRKLWRY
jgi:hypothetical protein